MTTREVELTGGAPWGFRMHGGADQNQPLRISRSYSCPESNNNVNPGRKASLSGIREGDVISSINGQPTKTMSNADAHAMLRSAGPVLRLGLNEDREMSPRRRSIGRCSELKRPSHLLSEINNELPTPHAPVYATIRPANSNQNRPPLSSVQSSLKSLSINSTSLGNSLTTTEEPFRFHPTNPFYTTLPSNYSNTSKLPVPNGRASLSSLDRSRSISKCKDNSLLNDYDSDQRSPSYFSLLNDSGPHSTIFSNCKETGSTNGHDTGILKLPPKNNDYPFARDSNLKTHDPLNEIKLNERNPFKTKRNSDPFDKFLRTNNKNDDSYKNETATMPTSISDSDIQKNDQKFNHLSIIKHEISEIEETKTIKKITMNGSSEKKTISDQCNELNNITVNTKATNQKFGTQEKSPTSEHYIKVQYSPKEEYVNAKSPSYSCIYKRPNDIYTNKPNISTKGQKLEEDNVSSILKEDTSSSNLVASKPPLKSPNTPAPANSIPKAVWRPGAPPAPSSSPSAAPSPSAPPPPPPPPIWTPNASPQTPRKNFRPVHFEDTPPARRKFASAEQNGCTSGSESEGRLRTSQSAPATGLSALGGTTTSRLPKAQNPTVTLLQKARENQISRSANTYEKDPRLPRDRPSPPLGDPVHALRKGYLSEGEAERREHVHGGSHKMADANRKVEGIGPTTKEGMPVALRSEVKDPTRWYKKMYDTIHKNKYDDDYVTIRYKNRQGQPPLRVSSSKSQYAYFDPRSGYLSEPEGGLSRLGSSTWSDTYDSDATAGPRRRTASVQEDRRDEFLSPYLPNNKYSTLASARASQEVYKTQPGRIENYMPGKSSVIDKEAKQWWDEVMDIFDGQNISSTTSLPQTSPKSPKERKDVTTTILSKSNMARALKESGYESDSTLIFRRREENEAPLSPAERRAAYKDLQAGGEPPLRGFRSPAPPRQDESEIEYIPISSTLTKIRVHKKTPLLHEVVCYPITKIQSKKLQKASCELKEPDVINDFPPAPPRRISSKNSRTLKLVTSSKHSSPSPSRIIEEQPNIKFLKNKLSNKLNRQNTHVIIKKDTKIGNSKLPRNRGFSTSPFSSPIPTKCVIEKGTSSFSSPRRTLPPTEYTSKNKYGEIHTSVIIESGAGRKTPISNILEKVTPLDKLWSSQKRNERIDIAKHKEKSNNKSPTPTYMKPSSCKITSSIDNKTFSRNITHKSRDMIRTSEKLQKFKTGNVLHKPNSTLNVKNGSTKYPKVSTLHNTINISKSTSNIPSSTKKQSNVRTAIVTNLKKKKSLECVVVRPRSVPCHESCNKKTKGVILKKDAKPKSHKKSGIPTVSPTPFDNDSFGDVICKQANLKELENTRDTIITDSFFRHLFLGNTYVPLSSTLKQFTINTVQQKAKMFQSLPQAIHNTSNYFNSYLTHRKPVSLSRFIVWDKNSSPTRVSSPRSVSWPGKMDGEIRKFQSLSKSDGFGSVSSLSTIRSKSEPPTNKIYFSQTSRPVSPNIVFYKKGNVERKSVSPSKIIYLQPKLTTSSSIQKNREHVKFFKSNISDTCSKNDPVPYNTQKLIKKIETEDDDGPTTIFFSQTSRPVSPKVIKNTISKSRSQSTSPGPFRSPSYRRIHNARVQSKQVGSSSSYKNEIRTRSADNSEKLKDNEMSSLRVKSDSCLHVNDPDYDEYIRDLQNSKLRTERFRELNRYYAYLERVAELEKATSACDLRLRKKDEEIIDFDRWKKIRAIERAEEELNNLYLKLKVAQSENSILFYPKDLNDFRWNSGKERGLRVKEKSVEDLKEELQQKSHVDLNESIQSKDHYKPLWRGTSVAETAFNINRKNEIVFKKSPIKPITSIQQDTTLSELQKKIGLGNRLWSSLSIEQVDALKRQLNAIYSKELEAKTNKENEKYTIEVKKTNSFTKPTLHVRCNSLTTPPNTSGHELSKSDSIAAITCSLSSEKELKNNVNKMQMTLSEIEKRKISQSLSKEVLNRITNNDKSALNAKKQFQPDKGNNNECIAENKNRTKKESISEKSTPDSTLKSNNVDEQKRHIVYAIDNNETMYQSSTSETETGSSDNSNKTVIYNCPNKEVLKKVEYFESVNKITNSPKNIHSVVDSSHDIKIKVESSNYPPGKNNEPEREKSISQSQSCTNFKELFGESEKNKFLSLPSKPDLYSRSPSPCSEVYISDRRTPDTPRCSSDEAIWRSRTPSPDPERYWRAYIKLARAGEVRRIARRFDSPSAAGAVLRRHRSDPEIARNVLNKEWSPFERIQTKRDKSRAILPVTRVPLRPTNRFMPHIDVISKLATLRKRTSPRSRSAEETLECRSGEVERIRRRFEAISLLGPIYSSAPDVRDLQEIAPYLAGPWIAHRYPKPSDNTKSIKDPGTTTNGRNSPIKKDINQVTSKKTVNLSSILKSELLGKQDFDPSVHRPVSRYVPPRAPPRPPPAAWPYRLGPLVTPSRHTVSFQVEKDSAPVPPRRIPQGSVSDTGKC